MRFLYSPLYLKDDGIVGYAHPPIGMAYVSCSTQLAGKTILRTQGTSIDAIVRLLRFTDSALAGIEHPKV